MNRFDLALALLLLVSYPCKAQAPKDPLRSLYDHQDWRALRIATQRSGVPLFYRAAVEAAYNDVKPAAKDLNAAVNEAPHSEDAYDAHGMLTNLYFRNGMYREALVELTAMLAEKPDAEDVKATILQLRAFGRASDQKTVRRKTSTTSMQMEQGNMFVPVTIDGSHANYCLDTGANFSVMSEGEAKRLGLQVSDSAAKMGDSSGIGVGMKVATAKNLFLAGLHLENVAFAVIPDSQEPFVELPKGHRAILGIPVLLAMEAIRWEPSGSLSLIRPHRANRFVDSNVTFTAMFPAARVSYQQSALTFALDTGAIRTNLEPHFAEKFPQLLRDKGEKTSHKVTGMGGSMSYKAITLPKVELLVGGFNAQLHPATVLLETSSASSDWADGNMGMDLLNQAHTITLDFKAMTLSLH